MKPKSNIWGVLKNMMKTGMLLTLIFIGMQVGGLYVDHKAEYPSDNVWEFITHEETDEYDSFVGAPSAEFIEKVTRLNKTTKTIWIAIFFYVMFELFSFKENKKEHWVTYMKKSIKKYEKKAEKSKFKMEEHFENEEADNRDNK